MSSTSTATVGSTSVLWAHDAKRACGTCRRRKVRCNGQHPCVSCRKSALECTYPAPPGKRGRKFRSQRPLQSVQDHLQRSATPSVFCEKLPESPLIGVAATFDSGSVDDGSQNRSPSSGSSPSMVGHDGLIMPELEPSPGSMSFYELQLGHSLWEETAAQATRQLPPVVFDSYLELFFQHIHPIMPVLDRRKYLDPSFLSGPTLPPDEYCLLTSLAALTTAQLQLPRQTPDFGPSDTFLLPGEYFVRECLQHRCKNDFIGNPSLAAITTSFLLFGYFGNLDQPATAWYYLREAITFCQMLGLDREDLTSRLPKSTAQQHRKMFWLLYITERAYALQRDYRTSLTPSIDLPDIFDSEEPRLLYGFVHLAYVFRSIDQTFIDLWQKTSRDQDCSRAWILDTHHALEASSPIPGTSNEIHQVDITVSRLWLHMLGWQISVQRQLLSSQAGEDAMKIDYPISISRSLLEVTCTTSQHVLDSHGIGLVNIAYSHLLFGLEETDRLSQEQKISDVANGLLDLLAVSARVNGQPHSEGREYLHGLLCRLSQMRGTQSRYLAKLLAKAEQSVGSPLLPTLAMRLEQAVDEREQRSPREALGTSAMHVSVQ